MLDKCVGARIVVLSCFAYLKIAKIIHFNIGANVSYPIHDTFSRASKFLYALRVLYSGTYCVTLVKEYS